MKVFLSSTYLDLIEYRKAVVNALRMMGEEVEHMEVFGARDEEPTKASIDELDKCDVLVGVYAYRYGTIPEGTETSVTEQEYLHATKKGIPILVFVVDENHPWPPRSMDENLANVKKFKSKATKEHAPEYFTNPDNLAHKINSSVGRLAKKLNPKPVSDSPTPIYESPKPTGNTLPTRTYFVGREKELAIIANAISPEARTWGALIDGPGGIGKTALAIESAHEVSDALFERKIFITAKVRELTPEGEKKLTDFTRPTYLAMLDELGKELGADGLEKLPPDDRPNELRLTLVGKKVLIVFDNLETLPDTEVQPERTRIFQFLSRLPDGNKAIVTSRRRSDVDARIVRLDRLSHDEAIQLIKELAKKYSRLQRAAPQEHDKLYAITQGNPLFIRWITGQLGREGSKLRTIDEAVSFIDNAPKGNDPLEYIFGDLLESFTEDETKVLAALTHFTQPARLKWIAQMTELPERVAETALEDLTDHSILIADNELQSFFIPSLTAQFIRNKRPTIVNEATENLINKAYTLVMENGFDKYENFPILEAEWGLISSAFSYFPTSKINQLMDLCSALGSFLNETDRSDEAIKLNEETEQKLLSINDIYNAGWHACAAGYAYHKLKQPVKVIDCAKRAETYWQRVGARELGIAYRIRGLGYQLEKNSDTAINTFKEAIKLLNTANPEGSYVALVLNDLAKVEFTEGFYEEANLHYNEAIRISKKKDNKNRIVSYTLNLVELHLCRGNWVEAENLAREVLSEAEEIGRQESIATGCYRLAKALLKQNKKLDEALPLSRRAVEIFTRLRHPQLQSAQETLAEIEKAVG